MKTLVRIFSKRARHLSDCLDDWCDLSVWHLAAVLVIGFGLVAIVTNVGLGVYAHAVLLK